MNIEEIKTKTLNAKADYNIRKVQDCIAYLEVVKDTELAIIKSFNAKIGKVDPHHRPKLIDEFNRVRYGSNKQ